MSGIKTLLNRRMGKGETVIVIAALAVLGAAGWWSYRTIAAEVLEAKVKAALPTVCGRIREERKNLIEAIEKYKSEFGFYPPDHIVSRQPLLINSWTNPLFYELAGIVVDTNGLAQIPGTEAAEVNFVKDFFHSTGFVNSGSSTNAVKRFISAQTLPWQQLHDDPDVYAIGFQLFSTGIPDETMVEFEISPWQYVSSAPAHNPGKFDLWIEVKTRHKRVTIGNWNEAQ